MIYTFYTAKEICDSAAKGYCMFYTAKTKETK